MKTLVLLLATCVGVELVCGIQSTVLLDLKKLEQREREARRAGDAAIVANQIPNKAKRAQEVILFGNQQNKLSDHNNYARADKRDVPSIPMPEEGNNLEKDIEEPQPYEVYDQAPSYQQLRSGYYYDPDIYNMDASDENRQKRNTMKRSLKGNRVFRSYPSGNRLKRESELDPEELLSLLALWEAEQRKHPYETKNNRFAPQEYEGYPNEEDNEIETDDGEDNDAWLEGPISPAHRYTVKARRFYPPYNPNLIPTRQARKYNNQDNEYAKVLAQLARNNRLTDQRPILHRRYQY